MKEPTNLRNNKGQWAKGRPNFYPPNKKGINLGEKNGMWKGNKASYRSLHYWLELHKEKSICENCKINKAHDFANISGQYKRDVNDYKCLCRKCHMIEDGRLKNLTEQTYKKTVEERMDEVEDQKFSWGAPRGY